MGLLDESSVGRWCHSMRGRLSARDLNAASVAALALIGGLLLGEQLAGEAQARILGAGSALIAPWLLLSARPSRRRGRRPIADLLLLLALVAVAFTRGASDRLTWEREQSRIGALRGVGYVRGRLLDAPGEADGRRLCIVALRPLAEGGPPQPIAPCDLLLRGEEFTTSDGGAGTWIEGFLRIEPARGARFPGASDDRRWLRRREASAWGLPLLMRPCPSGRDGERADLRGGVRTIWRRAQAAPGEGYRALTVLRDGFRRGVGRWIRTCLPGDCGGFATAFLLGRRAARSADAALPAALEAAGAGHLLAVSGLHVGLVAGGLALLLAALPIGRGMRRLLLAAMILTYAFLVGWSASVARAAGGAAVWCALRAAGRSVGIVALLPMVAAVALWIDPSAWKGAGFQLSYLVSLALLLSARGRSRGANGPRWSSAHRQHGRARIRVSLVGRGLRALMAAQLTAWPLLLGHFGSASPLFFASNAILVPLAGGLMPVLLGSLFLRLIPAFPADVASAPGSVAVECFLRLAAEIAPWCERTRICAPLPAEVALPVAVAVVMILYWRRRLFAILIAAALLVTVTVDGKARGELPQLIMLDVGQGESWLLLWPQECWVVDTGADPGTEGRPRALLRAMLRHFGRHRIDRLFLTHADRDHVGGIAEINTAGIPVGCVHHPVGWRPPPWLRRWLRGMQAAGTSVAALEAGDTLRTPAGWAAILHPQAKRWRGGHSRGDDPGGQRNAGSLALQVASGDLRLLISADLPAPVQEDWISRGRLGPCQVISAAHHGSGGSTPAALLRVTRPAVVLISVGAGNQHGHPHASLLERVASSGALCLRTDQEGSILLRRDGASWHLETTASGRRIKLDASSSSSHRRCLETKQAACYKRSSFRVPREDSLAGGYR